MVVTGHPGGGAIGGGIVRFEGDAAVRSVQREQVVLEIDPGIFRKLSA
jgi:hypothetical protein